MMCLGGRLVLGYLISKDSPFYSLTTLVLSIHVSWSCAYRTIDKLQLNMDDSKQFTCKYKIDLITLIVTLMMMMIIMQKAVVLNTCCIVEEFLAE